MTENQANSAAQNNDSACYLNTDAHTNVTRTTDRSSQLAVYIGSFLDELVRGGVRDVVISPGSRSTPLAMMAFASPLNVYVDVDERGAAFFALGLAKATGRVVAIICTSGTAVANYYPAVLEAESSRVPLLVLSGDRPARLQQLGAPQTCDQLKIFGDHVRRFWNMPELNGSLEQVKHARQMAREALAALEPHTLTSAPVHINFPFDEPLVPDWEFADAFSVARDDAHTELPLLVETDARLDAAEVQQFKTLFANKRVIALCGEGTLGSFDAEAPDCWDVRVARARALCAWAHAFDIPLLADPLSQLRAFDDDAIIDGYDNIFRRSDCPDFDVVVRFGRYPVSKRVFKALESKPHLQIVVDPLESRDFNAATTTLVKAMPLEFIASFGVSEAVAAANLAPEATTDDAPANASSLLINKWVEANERERKLVESVEEASFVYTCTAEGCRNEEVALEGAYVRTLVDCMPERSLLFSANSMAIRALDTFYVKHSTPDEGVVQLGSLQADAAKKQLTILANRGLNGIDGTLSSALGAAQAYDQTYFLTGDLTLLHDLNALALQHEFALRAQAGESTPKVIIVLFNNGGGGIFDMLPQKSDAPYFERLFLTPQSVDFEAAAKAFGVLYKRATSLKDFRDTLDAWEGDAGIHLLEVVFSLCGLSDRYRPFQ